MGKRAALVVLLLCAAVAPGAVAQKTKTQPELFGVRLDMSEAEARARLNKIGRWEEEKELRRDSVWALDGDRRFAYLVVGFDKETRRVRYVTAKAREGGERVRYAEVLDLKRARRVAAATNNYWFTQEVRPQKGHPHYLITGRGTDPKFLTYLSVKRIERASVEEDDDK